MYFKELFFVKIVILLTFCWIGCGQATIHNSVDQNVLRFVENDHTSNQEYKIIKSKLLNGNNLDWKIDKINNELKEKAQRYFFLNKEIGWAYGQNLYVTKDGKTWDLMKIDKLNDELISKVFFSDSDTGWVVIQSKKEDYLKSSENYFRFFATTNNGKSWIKQSEIKGVTISDLNFANKRIGWLFGRKYVGNNPARFEIFMLITNNGGETWKDVSETLNNAIIENQKVSNQSVGAITFSENNIVLISAEHQIFQTNDFGNNWTHETNLPDNYIFTSVGIKNINILDNKSVHLIGSFYHYSALSTIIKRLNNGWEAYKLENHYFSDGSFLSNDEIIITGLKTHKSKKPTGIILTSPDGGKTWKTLIENNTTENINHLQIINSSTIVASDEDGNLYWLDKNL